LSPPNSVSAAIERFLADRVVGKRRKPGFRRGVVVTLGEFIPHETRYAVRDRDRT
jgi:hypothetical protein